MKKKDTKVVNAWTFYDWANSVYNLVITATIFPIYYKAVTTDNISFLKLNFKNTELYDYALAFAYLIIASIAPLLSGIADYGGNKKKFMQFFCYLGGISCSMMYFFTSQNLWLGILLLILACIGYSGSIVFYNAYLPEIAPPEEQDRVSAKGFAMGYAGSSILLIFNLSMAIKPEWYGLTKAMAPRIAFLTVGIWWILFAQIPFYFLPGGKKTKKNFDGSFLVKGYKELQKVWRELKHAKKLTRFLTAFFIYSMGVQTVMLVATHFGAEEIKMKAEQLIVTILIIQFIAILGAYLFSRISKTKGNIFTLQLATFVWAGICIAGYFIKTPNQFYIIAFMVGLVMGGIQSLSRSTYSKMLPETSDHASYFSFYDICEKISIVLGMALFGFINGASNSLRNPLLALFVFFVVGFLLLIRVNRVN